jgi:hypothetical protein
VRLAGHRRVAATQAYIDVNDEMKWAAVELVGLRGTLLEYAFWIVRADKGPALASCSRRRVIE